MTFPPEATAQRFPQEPNLTVVSDARERERVTKSFCSTVVQNVVPYYESKERDKEADLAP